MSHKIPEAEAVELMLAKNLKPLESYPGRAKPWKCLCLICENTVTPRLASIRLGQGGCVYCAGKATISEKDAREILKHADLRPLEPYKGSRIGWKSECVNCGQISTPRVDTVKNRGARCRANPKEIQEWVGHASIEETMDTYGHLFPNAKHQLSNMLDNHARRHSDNPQFEIAN